VSEEPESSPHGQRVDLNGRPLEMRAVDWDALFAPTAVVVVGASDRPGTQQRAQWEQVSRRLSDRGARVVPVHPTKPDILGTPAYPSVLDVPFDVDLAIVLVREPLPVLEECIKKGVRAAVVFAAGFAEVGTEEGDDAQRRLEDLSSGALRVLGPNTNLNIFQPFHRDLPGKRLAIITQSGYQGRPIAQGDVLGIAIESWATVGNEVDLEFSDFAAYYSGLPGVGAIAGYVEGFKDGRRLMVAADRAAAHGVPIVLVKVGRSDEGRKMAQAHTGHLTGSDAVHQAVFEQCGIIRVDDIDELIEIAGMFCHTSLLPAGSAGGVAIYAMSGGTASHMVDLCAAAGLVMPRLEEDTIERLSEHIPWFLRKDNPVDTGGTITALPAGRAVLDLMVADRNTDVLLAPITGVFPGMSDALAKDLIELHRQGRKPVIAIWTSPLREDPAYRALCEAGVPMFHSYSAAVKGIKALVDFSVFVSRRRDHFAGMPEVRSQAGVGAAAFLADKRAPTEIDALEVLRDYGVRTVESRLVTSAEEAEEVAISLGLPVVAKVVSGDIAHKSDLGLVALGLSCPEAVARVTDEILRDAAQKAPGAEIEGVLLQPMLSDALAEVIVGVSNQDPFGPTVLFGLGGVFTEVFADVAFRVPPFDRDSARRMIESTRAASLLKGARGRPPCDTEAIIDVLMAVQTLALDLEGLVDEMDVNPLLVFERGKGAIAVDALLVPRRDHPEGDGSGYRSSDP